MKRADQIRALQRSFVVSQVQTGASVLDLGCGDGALLEQLRTQRSARVQGIDLDQEAVLRSLARGVPVIQADLDRGLTEFGDAAFDVVILSRTLQQVRRPLYVMAELLRVGRRAILSFPNFGHLRVRADLMLRGRMPISDHLPYQWFDTPNIHLFTLRDMMDLLAMRGVRVVERLHLGRWHSVRVWPNLRAMDTTLVLEGGRFD